MQRILDQFAPFVSQFIPEVLVQFCRLCGRSVAYSYHFKTFKIFLTKFESLINDLFTESYVIIPIIKKHRYSHSRVNNFLLNIILKRCFTNLSVRWYFIEEKFWEACIICVILPGLPYCRVLNVISKAFLRYCDPDAKANVNSVDKSHPQQIPSSIQHRCVNVKFLCFILCIWICSCRLGLIRAALLKLEIRVIGEHFAKAVVQIGEEEVVEMLTVLFSA